MSLNMCFIRGRLTAAPDKKLYNGDKTMCRFAVAVDRDRKNADGSRSADFFNCAAFGTNCDFICKYFEKGSDIEIVGRMANNAYTDKEGKNRVAFEITVQQAYFGSRKKSSPAQQTGELPPLMPVDGSDSDLPF